MTAASIKVGSRQLETSVRTWVHHRWTSVATAIVLVTSALTASGYIVVQHIWQPTTISAIFSTANSIYPGDEVRIAGVKVGTIESITPLGQRGRFTMDIDHGIAVAADAKAVIVAPNLVSARFVQLTPAYDTGPRLGDGAEIPRSRTSTPVEWDEVKRQLDRLATDLGPNDVAQSSSAGRLIDSAANAMAGNGDKLRQTLAQLAGVSRILADHRQHRRHHHEPAEIRVRAARQQHPNRAIPGTARQPQHSPQWRQVRSGLGADQSVPGRRRGHPVRRTAAGTRPPNRSGDWRM